MGALEIELFTPRGKEAEPSQGTAPIAAKKSIRDPTTRRWIDQISAHEHFLESPAPCLQENHRPCVR